MNSRLNVSAGREFFREIAGYGYETTLCVEEKKKKRQEKENVEKYSRGFIWRRSTRRREDGDEVDAEKLLVSFHLVSSRCPLVSRVGRERRDQSAKRIAVSF